MDHSTSLLRLIFLTLGAALVVLMVRSAFRLPRDIDSTTSSFLHDDDDTGCSRLAPWACRRSRAHQKPKTSSSHESDVPRHPLDPLTVTEINRAREVLHAHPPFSSAPSSLLIHSLALDEPEKPLVLRWRKGADPLPPRRAVAVVRFRGAAHVLAVDLGSGEVTALPVPVTGYPTMTMDEQTTLCLSPFSDARFNASVRRRGVRLSDVACLPISLGWYGPTEEGRRLIKVQCYSAQGTANFYMRPIEGLTVLVDMDTRKVLHVSDRGTGIPIPKPDNTDYRSHVINRGRGRVRDEVRAPSMEPAASGPGLEVEDGHTVRWGGWELHVKADARAGMVVSRARVRDPDTGLQRDVLYKGMASELFVPYMDPSEAWYFKTYMDAGEYGFGLQAMPLVPLNDCPRHARYLDGVFVAADGRPYVRENMICVFERYAGDIAWRHSESPITGMDVSARLSLSMCLRVRFLPIESHIRMLPT